MSMTKHERLILLNQFRILEKLDKEEAPHYRRNQEILTNGFIREYPRLYAGLIDEISREDCDDVCEILNMYRSLKLSWKALDDKTDIAARRVEFPGFDGNNEAEHMDYARFLKEGGEWEEVGSGDLNSHTSSLEHYRLRVERWKASADLWALTAADIRRILDF
jgi:uncharacterized protein YfbU (UPF0304 family)